MNADNVKKQVEKVIELENSLVHEGTKKITVPS